MKCIRRSKACMGNEKRERFKGMEAIQNNLYFLKKGIYASPGFILLSALMRIVDSIRTTFMSVFFLAYVISCVENKQTLTYILEFIGFSFMVVGFTYLCQSIFDNIYKPVYREKAEKRLQHELFHIILKSDMCRYDKEEYYNAVMLAGSEGAERIFSVVDNMLNLLGAFLTLLLISVSTMTIDLIVPAIAVLSFLLSFAIQRRLANERAEYDTDIKLNEKEASMLQRILYLPAYAKDIRLSGVKQMVFDRYDSNNQEKVKLIREKGSRIGRMAALETIISACLLIDFLAPFCLAVRALILSTITASGFVAVLNACNQIQFSLEAFTTQISVFFENGKLIERFRRVENMHSIIESDAVAEELDSFESLKIKNVYFRYEDNKFGLQNVNIDIKRGDKVAFVGRNGSGKTTLIKLLLRLYDCEHGEILYNGKPIKSINVNTYRKAYSTLFQDFNLYAASVAENVAMHVNINEDKVKRALNDAQLAEAVEMVNDILTKEFNAEGIDFSGGQRQRLALARVFYENHDVLVMDEPTAAMDVSFEKKFYDLLFSHLREKTVLMVSHRLASVIACNKIFYLEGGRVIEQGNHQELMAQNGKYAELFKAQLS